MHGWSWSSNLYFSWPQTHMHAEEHYKILKKAKEIYPSYDYDATQFIGDSSKAS